jgi:hypothetical protein
MQLHEVPTNCRHLVTSDDPQKIAEALQEAVQDCELYIYWDRILGARRSGRILLTNHAFEAVVVRSPDDEPEVIADDLVYNLTTDARYDPPHVPGKQKGWEVWATMVDNDPAAIVWAAWV